MSRNMCMRLAAWFPGLVLGASLAGCTGMARVDSARMAHVDADPGQWMSYGRGYDEQRFSPLSQINADNASRLGLAWYADLDTYRGVQGTPLVVDGVLYNVSVWNVVTAYDARNGRVLWRFDPEVAREWARLACCGPSARGIALWQGRVYVAALDGRLIAVDARNGRELWSVQTFDRAQAYSITGPPRVFDGKVVIGNGGADYGVRGYVTAYDARDGRKLWRFYTVPGDPSKGPDGEASDSVMPLATRTWNGEWWKYGGGGTVWDSIVYDPKLRLVYLGTGNGAPHVQHFRSPGGGDNLFLCSMVAVDADTGEYRWHYQMVPEEQWDFTCTQPMMLADLPIGGRTRQVIMQAPKNGFFYVLDRGTGELLSAKSYVPNLWATGIDMQTGRPKVNPGAYVTETPQLMTPTWMAAHSWHPMAFHPGTGLVYFAAQEQWIVQARVPDGEFRWVPFRSNSGMSYSSQPERRRELQAIANSREKGYLLAWDPVNQREAFRVDYPYPGSGGVLATAGNLLVQGTIRRSLAVYRATDGHKLWEFDTQSVPIAGPVSYSVDGVQYLAVNVGWGGSPVHGLTTEKEPVRFGPGRLMVFRLDATGVALPPMPPPTTVPPPPPLRASEAQVQRGRELYAENCVRCHGVNAVGGLKDLRFMSAETRAAFNAIVLDGVRKDKGMAGFRDVLGETDVAAINAWLVARANEDYADHIALPPPPVPADVPIADRNVHPESVTSTADGTLYVGSLKGNIYRSERGRGPAMAWIRPDAANGLQSVFGVLAHEASGTLWACSVPNPFAAPVPGAVAELLAFELASGALKARYPFPAPRAVCNDMTVAADGAVFAADTQNGRILRLPPRGQALEVWADDPALKGVDGIAFASDGQLYVNLVNRGAVLRVGIAGDGRVGALTELQLDASLGGPDGMRLLDGNRFLLAEGTAGRIVELRIEGDRGFIKVLRSGLDSSPGVTAVGRTAYAIEGKIGYLVDPARKGQDPGEFRIIAIPLPQE
ncbi:MAG: hypothetical protein RL026_449 [Pseudomonadota bacterium]|jgi:quinohemoprotein ethanol dehydrogenase